MPKKTPSEFFPEASVSRADFKVLPRTFPFSITTQSRNSSEDLKDARDSIAFTRTSSQLIAGPQEETAALTASADAPENAAICTSPSQSISVFCGRCSSSTTWKLLPPKPSALIAARRGPSESHGRFSVLK